MQQRRRRSGFILGLVALGLLGGAALTAGPAQAVSGPGPYLAPPAWDQIKGAGRFLILTNWNSQAVLDKETGLVWERAPQATLRTWDLLPFDCASRITGGRKGWRLPSVHELASLVDPSQANPALPLNHPFINIQSLAYWSATTYGANSVQAWFVIFNGINSGAVFTGVKTTAFSAWCVRGGNNADQY